MQDSDQDYSDEDLYESLFAWGFSDEEDAIRERMTIKFKEIACIGLPSTAEWFNGVFLFIKLTHDFKKKSAMNLWVNFGLKFTLFYKGKMAKMSLKTNKIEIWPKSCPKVINSRNKSHRDHIWGMF